MDPLDFHQPHSTEEITHFNLEQAAATRRQRERASKMSALLITIVVHAVAILILTLIVLPALQMDVPQIKAKSLPPTEGTIDTPVVTQTTVKSKPSSPSSSAKLITSHAAAAAVFVPVQPVETTIADIGMGTSLGMGFGGVGLGDGQGGLGGLPGSMKGRCTPQERLKRLREGGGTEACETAVVKALRWLAANQNSDGSWGSQFKGSMTGLALLAYFGHCETPRSTEFGVNVTKGLEFMINLGNAQGGKLSQIGGHSWVYEHGIGTYALCEGLTFIKELKIEFPGLQEATAKAVDMVLKGQHPSGFWDYDYNKTSQRPGDLSVAGWHVQALKAAHHAGFASKDLDKAIDIALEKTASVQADNGTFGYTNKADLGQRLVGVGVLCFQLWGKENHKAARDGLRWMNREMEPVYSASTCNLYAWYYTTLALFQRGSTYWDRWNKKWRDEMLNNQKEDGSWKPEGNVAGGAGHLSTKGAGRDADIYRVCLNTLSLEAYYRFLPGTGGDKR
jgi:hypothetical protein